MLTTSRICSKWSSTPWPFFWQASRAFSMTVRKVTEFGIFEHPRKIARRPELHSGLIDALDAFKRVANSKHWQLIAHRVALQPTQDTQAPDRIEIHFL